MKLEFKQGNIAHLKLYHFSEKAVFVFREAAIEILESKVHKIILEGKLLLLKILEKGKSIKFIKPRAVKDKERLTRYCRMPL